MTPLLDVSGLTVGYFGNGEPVWAVRGASFTLEWGRVLGVVGESGSGKTTLGMALLRLLRPPGRIVQGQILFQGEPLLERSSRELRRLRGRRLALVPQAAMNALNPASTVSALVLEALGAHADLPRRKAAVRAAELLESVGIPHDRRRAYPHELSGGMRQRVVIAIALANDPTLVIADEPVTGLDVIVQAQILQLLRRLRAERGLSMIFISHDLPVVASIADSLLVLRQGAVVEQGPARRVLEQPRAAYTRALVDAVPRLNGRRARSAVPAVPVLQLRGVRKTYARRAGPLGRGAVSAVDGVSFDVRRGEAVGLVGESGSGKTTIAQLVFGLKRPDEGTLHFGGNDIGSLPEARLRLLRRQMHLIFQDPYEALSPRMRVRQLVAEPLAIHGALGRDRDCDRPVHEALTEAGLVPADEFTRRFPHELSGGQRQRVALARALVLRPSLIVADEPTSMLDAPLRKGLVDTMAALRARHGIAFLFITHDLALAADFCDRIAVVHRGRVVEIGPADAIVHRAGHPYTKALLRAARDLQPPAEPVPSAAERTPLIELEPDHYVEAEASKGGRNAS